MKINSFLKVLVVQLTLVSTFFGSVSAINWKQVFSQEGVGERELTLESTNFQQAMDSQGKWLRDCPSLAPLFLDTNLGCLTKIKNDNVMCVVNFLRRAKDTSRVKKLFKQMIIARRKLLSGANHEVYNKIHQMLSIMFDSEDVGGLREVYDELANEASVFVGDDQQFRMSLIERNKKNRVLFEIRLREIFQFLHPGLEFKIPSKDVRMDFPSDDILASIIIASRLFYNTLASLPLGEESKRLDFYGVKVSRRSSIPIRPFILFGM
jgi:hypothetical protein